MKAARKIFSTGFLKLSVMLETLLLNEYIW